MSFKNIRAAFLALTFILFVVPGTLFAQIDAPSPPSLEAKGYLLIDSDSGQVLATRNADEAMDPASITKMMTAYAVFRAIKSGQINLDDEVRVSEKAWRTPGSRMFIEVGTKVPVKELLPGMIISSGNDASVALAEFVAGTEESFAEVMNQLAEELGMLTTNYRNSTGLSAEGHYTSASDIAILANALVKEFPDYYKWYSQKQYTYNSITQGNRNTLLWRDDSVDGIKTGHTESAGYCLVSSAKRGNMRLVAVVLGTASAEARANDSQALLNYGFRFFETHKLYEAGETISDARIWKGTVDKANLIVREPVYITIPRGGLENIEKRVEIPRNLIAPLGTDKAVASMRIRLGIDTAADVPLFLAAAVAEDGFLGALWDELLLWFE